MLLTIEEFNPKIAFLESFLNLSNTHASSFLPRGFSSGSYKAGGVANFLNLQRNDGFKSQNIASFKNCCQCLVDHPNLDKTQHLTGS
jgi:hypothetical protein